MRFWQLIGGALFLTLLGAACSASLGEDSRSGLPADGQGGQFGIGGAAPSAGSAGTAGRPPERELESRYLAPVVTGNYLWTANPLSGRVALIDATTLSVTLETAGNGPRQVVGLPEVEGRFGALVLNELSDDATLFRVEGDGVPVKFGPLRTHEDANTWTVSPGGRYAIAWTDSALREDLDPLQTFQDVTLLVLDPGRESAVPLSVGSRPSAVAFSADEAFAYAVTDEGMSVIALSSTPEVRDLILLDDDPFADSALRDVGFAPDATYAVVRTEGRSEVGVVALPEGTRTPVTLEGVVTDVDLSPDGEVAFAVLGNEGVVVRIPVAEAARDPSSFDRLSFGAHPIGAIALNADASAAVLYSTVFQSNRVSLVDMAVFDDPEAIRSYDLIAPVTAVFASPDPRFAVTFQGRPSGSQKAGAFSLLMLTAQRLPRIQATDAAPAQIAFSSDGAAALVTVRGQDTEAFGAYLVDLASQRTDFVALASPPDAAGVITSARRAYVAQSHPEGRITFISTEDGSVQTLTGFELAARIRSR